MFEIPDDDENFWETLPLEDISNSVPNDKHKDFSKAVVNSTIKKCHTVNNPGIVTRSNSSVDLPSERTKNFSVPTSFKLPSKVDHHSSEDSNGFQREIRTLRTEQKLPTECGLNVDKVKESFNPVSALRKPNHESGPQFPPVYHTIASSNPRAQGQALDNTCNIVNEHPSGNAFNNSNKNNHNTASTVAAVTPVSCGTSVLRTRARDQKETSEQSYGKKHEDEINSERTRKKHVKRKFPGPAGLLPSLFPGQVLRDDVADDLDVKPSKAVKSDDVILSSQSTEDLFQSQSWMSLLEDLGRDSDSILRRFSINSSILKASKKQLPRGKVPLIFGVIEHIDFEGSDAGVTLKDKTGKITGSLHRDIVKDYAFDINPGTVLVLRQVGVISPTSRNHYLNITHNNVVIMYTIKNKQIKRIKGAEVASLPHVVQSVEAELRTVVEESQKQRMSCRSGINNHNGNNDVLQKGDSSRLWNGSFSSPKPEMQKTRSLSTPGQSGGYRFISASTPQISNCNRNTSANNTVNKSMQSTPDRTSSVAIRHTERLDQCYPAEKNQTPTTSKHLGSTGTESFSHHSRHLPGTQTPNSGTCDKSFSSLTRMGSDNSMPCYPKGTPNSLNSKNSSAVVNKTITTPQSSMSETKQRPKFSFKQKSPTLMLGPQSTLLSPGIKNVCRNDAVQGTSTDVGLTCFSNSMSTPADKQKMPFVNKKPAFCTDNLWQDDLTDDVLSQLSDDMF